MTPKCKRKKYKDEEAVKKAIWAMAINGRKSEHLKPERCTDGCAYNTWHMVRTK